VQRTLKPAQLDTLDRVHWKSTVVFQRFVFNRSAMERVILSGVEESR